MVDHRVRDGVDREAVRLEGDARAVHVGGDAFGLLAEVQHTQRVEVARLVQQADGHGDLVAGLVVRPVRAQQGDVEEAGVVEGVRVEGLDGAGEVGLPLVPGQLPHVQRGVGRDAGGGVVCDGDGVGVAVGGLELLLQHDLAHGIGGLQRVGQEGDGVVPGADDLHGLVGVQAAHLHRAAHVQRGADGLAVDADGDGGVGAWREGLALRVGDGQRAGQQAVFGVVLGGDQRHRRVHG